MIDLKKNLSGCSILLLCSLLTLSVPGVYAQSKGAAFEVKTTTFTLQKPAEIEKPATQNQAENGNGLRLNFRGVPLDTVLDYLSKAAGFVIVRAVDVTGTIDVWSHQPLSKEEAVDLLNTVLNEKGFAAVRNGRTLTIVTREEAKKRNIPVKTGNVPEKIPSNDELVTQIIPVKYVNATKLVDDLKQLLPTYAILTANESSNALVLTDIQTNIRRVTEIIQALDTSISTISGIKVYPLKFADAVELAKVVTQIFQNDTTNSNNQRNRQQFFGRMGGGGGGFPGMPGMPGGGGNAGGGQASDGSNSEALKAASRVVAVADQHTNSLVISAPDELLPAIETIVKSVDVASEDVTELRVFFLKNSDAQETAQVITDLFQTTNNQSTQNQSGAQRFGMGMRFGGGPMGGMGGGMGGANRNNQSSSDRKVLQNSVTAVADVRTNSVIITAASDMMEQIARMIEKLDENPSKKQNVSVYKLEYADVDSVATILRSMFEEQNTNLRSNSSSSSSRNSSSSSSNRNSSNNSSNRNSSSSNRNSGSGNSNSGFGF